MTTETETVCEAIKNLLVSHSIEFREAQHSPTRTSAESAVARGEDVAIGGKAIVLKVGEQYKLFVLSAAKRIDSQKIKRHFGEKKLRFATAAELFELTGLEPGAVPPFGNPILPLELYVDVSVSLNESVAFNAGSLTTSIIMRSKDYLKIAGGTVFEFAA